MRDHDLRRRAVGEMHLRRWPTLSVPCHIIQWVLLVDSSDREAERQMVEARASDDMASGNPSHLEGVLGDGIRFAWESHSEGSSFTLFHEQASSDEFLDPDHNADLVAALDWARSLPGEIVRSTRIWVTDSDASADALLPALYLSSDELVSCRFGGGKMRMWSDFRVKEDGFGRLVVAVNGADPRDATRQVQRLQELGNYRNRALLGLPLAQQTWPKLDQAEERLKAVSSRVAGRSERDDDLLDSLSELALELATVSNAIDFRMDATGAYARLVEERLAQLRGEPIDGFPSLADFTQRRFRPAISTCVATVNRVDRLALRVEQLSSLLRARIETRIENQNAQLLRSMERSVSTQVRLQQLVEGLSIVALTYYFIGLVAYLLNGIPEQALPINHKVAIAVLIVPVMLVVWLTTRTLKKRLLETDEA